MKVLSFIIGFAIFLGLLGFFHTVFHVVRVIHHRHPICGVVLARMTRLSRIARAAFAWMIPLALIGVGCGVFFGFFTVLGLGLDALFAWLAG